MATCGKCGAVVADTAASCPNCRAKFDSGGGGILSILFMAVLRFFPIIMFALVANELFTKTLPQVGGAVAAWARSLPFGEASFLGKPFHERATFMICAVGSIVLYPVFGILGTASRRSGGAAWIPFRVVEFLYIATSYAYLGAFVGNLAWVVVSLPFSGGSRLPVPGWVPAYFSDLYGRLKGPSWIPIAFTVFMIACVVVIVYFAWSAWAMNRRKAAKS